MKNIILILLINTILLSESFFYNNNNKVILTPYYEPSATNVRNVSTSDIKYYKQSNDTIIGIDNQILLKLNDGYSIDLLLAKYNLTVVKIYTPMMYLVSINSYEDTLSIANSIHKESSIKYAQPNIYAQVQNR